MRRRSELPWAMRWRDFGDDWRWTVSLLKYSPLPLGHGHYRSVSFSVGGILLCDP